MIEPRPNDLNAWPAGVSAVTIPARWNSRQPQCTARQTAACRAAVTRHLALIHHFTGTFLRVPCAGQASGSNLAPGLGWEAGPTERPVTVAASWPQAPSISRPRVSLTVTAT